MSSTLPEHVRRIMGDGGPSRGHLYDLLTYHLFDRQWDGYPDFRFDPQPPPADPTKILIVELSSIGDVTTVLPTIHSMAEKWTGADVEFLCEKECDTAVNGHPGLSACHRMPSNRWIDRLENGQGEQSRKELRDFLHTLKKRSYDYVVNLHWTPFAAYVTRFFHPSHVNGLTIDDRLRPVIRGNPLRYLKYRKMAEEKSAAIPLNSASYKRLSADVARGDTQFYARRDDSEYSSTMTRYDRETDGERPHVLVNTGSRMEPRQWPADHCAKCLKTLDEKLNVEIGLIGGPGDEERLKSVESSLSGEISMVPWYRMTESLMEDVYLSDRSDLTISTDSGPLHLISIRGNRVLDIAGDMWVGPWNQDSLVIRESGGNIGDLNPDQVARSGLYLLEEGPMPGSADNADWFRSPWPVNDFWFRHVPVGTISKQSYLSWLSGMVSLKLWLEEARVVGWDGITIDGDTFREITKRVPVGGSVSTGRAELNVTGAEVLNGDIPERVSSILAEWDI